MSEKRKVAPIALIPGVRDNCPRGDWSKRISKSIKHKAEVKCVHAGDVADYGFVVGECDDVAGGYDVMYTYEVCAVSIWYY